MEGVVLYKIDGKAESKLKDSYGMKGFPVFVLSNADGSKTEKWKGYKKDSFIKILGEKLAAVQAE